MHRPPRPRGRILVGPLLLGLVLFGTGEALGQQNLGHKVLGGVGIDAGTQVEPGLYFAGRVLHFGADELRDRDGDPVPLEGLDIDAVGAAVGWGLTLKPRAPPTLVLPSPCPSQGSPSASTIRGSRSTAPGSATSSSSR